METLICYQCNYQTQDKSNYISHQKTKRHNKKTIDVNSEWFQTAKCVYCDFSSENLQVMKKHIIKHKLKSHSCVCCDETFKNKIDLDMHLNTIVHYANLRNKLYSSKQIANVMNDRT